MTDEQAPDKKLQSFSLALLPLKKLDAQAADTHAAHHRGVDHYGLNVAGNLQGKLDDRSYRKFNSGPQATPAHRNVHQRAISRSFVGCESNRKTHFHAIVFASIFLDPEIPNPPLEKSEAIAAELAFKRINVKDADKPFDHAAPGNPPDKITSTVWTL
jgi:hypothetical protein